MIDPYRPQITI